MQHGAFDSKFEDYQFIEISVECLIQGLFCAGAGMITFGALLGKASPTQLVLILLLEVPIYAFNAEYLVGGLFGKMGAQVRVSYSFPPDFLGPSDSYTRLSTPYTYLFYLGRWHWALYVRWLGECYTWLCPNPAVSLPLISK